MTRDISEPDWKRFHHLHPVALERFCQRILNEVEETKSNSKKSFHQRYLDIYKLIERRDKDVAATFSDLRRSTALIHIIALYNLDLFTEAEFAGFSQEVQGVVKSLLK